MNSAVQEKFRELYPNEAEKFDVDLCCEECMTSKDGWTGITKESKETCACNVLLLKKKKEKEWTRMRPCPIMDRGLRFELCSNNQEDNCELSTDCTFPHSEFEREIWEMEQNDKMNLTSLHKKLRRYLKETLPNYVKSNKNVQFPNDNLDASESSPQTHGRRRHASQEERTAIDEALKKEYDFQLGCSTCFLGIERSLFQADAHKPGELCAQHFLFAKKKACEDGGWWRIRTRQSADFLGNHMMCQYDSDPALDCLKSDECTFPHNEIEKKLWDMDKNFGFFTIEAFFRSLWNGPEIFEMFFNLQVSFWMVPEHEVFFLKDGSQFQNVVQKGLWYGLQEMEHEPEQEPEQEKAEEEEQEEEHDPEQEPEQEPEQHPMQVIPNSGINEDQRGDMSKSGASKNKSRGQPKVEDVEKDKSYAAVAKEEAPKPLNKRFCPPQAAEHVNRTSGVREQPKDALNLKNAIAFVQKKFRESLSPQYNTNTAANFDAFLCCERCSHGKWRNITITPFNHKCDCNVLLLKKKLETEWTRVKHCPIMDRPGLQLELCKFVESETGCKYHTDCTYPHSELEKKVWKMEQMRKMNLKNVQKNMEASTKQYLAGIRDDLQKAGAPTSNLHWSGRGNKKYVFQLGCRTCFLWIERSLFVCDQARAHKPGKRCPQHFLFTKEEACEDGRWWRIRTRPPNFQGSYEMCKFNSDTSQPMCFNFDLCDFPHSDIELQLWCEDRIKKGLIEGYIRDMRTQPSEPDAIFFPFDLRGTNDGRYECFHPTKRSMSVRPVQYCTTPLYERCNRNCPSGDPYLCPFAHNEAELCIWNWMKKYKISSLTDICEKFQLPDVPDIARDAPPTASEPCSDPEALPHGRNNSSLAEPKRGFVCEICRQTSIPDERQYFQHLGSKKHRDNEGAE